MRGSVFLGYEFLTCGKAHAVEASATRSWPGPRGRGCSPGAAAAGEGGLEGRAALDDRGVGVRVEALTQQEPVDLARPSDELHGDAGGGQVRGVPLGLAAQHVVLGDVD